MRYYQSYNAEPIRPGELAVRSGFGACGLRGIDPISVATGVGKLLDGLRDLFGGLFEQNRDVHIEAQEITTDTFAGILDIVEDSCRQGGGVIPRAVVDNAVDGIRKAMNEFRTMVDACVQSGKCHSSRAPQGVADEQALADAIIRDLRNGMVRDCSFTVSANGGSGTFPGGGILPGTSNGGGLTALLPIGLLAAFLFK